MKPYTIRTIIRFINGDRVFTGIAKPGETANDVQVRMCNNQTQLIVAQKPWENLGEVRKLMENAVHKQKWDSPIHK